MKPFTPVKYKSDKMNTHGDSEAEFYMYIGPAHMLSSPDNDDPMLWQNNTANTDVAADTSMTQDIPLQPIQLNPGPVGLQQTPGPHRAIDPSTFEFVDLPVYDTEGYPSSSPLSKSFDKTLEETNKSMELVSSINTSPSKKPDSPAQPPPTRHWSYCNCDRCGEPVDILQYTFTKTIGDDGLCEECQAFQEAEDQRTAARFLQRMAEKKAARVEAARIERRGFQAGAAQSTAPPSQSAAAESESEF